MALFVQSDHSLVFEHDVALLRVFEVVHESRVLVAEQTRHEHAHRQAVHHLFLLVAEQQVGAEAGSADCALLIRTHLQNRGELIKNELRLVIDRDN